ncbi:hypothetical protein QQ056_11615 [Oscillatoria laete-virens NRMC-F 0139]|nr:HEAT repeat domain-containing protein [Oscillatoria laete-virens]MDL5054190.1 hypothetical protein [Oscillatoria laete-virens NRMC-F 0139]
MPGAQGAGIFGLGVLVDFEGDDTFEAGSCAQGFGFFGLGILESCMGSRQSFKGRTLVQGAALFGGGILRQVMEGHTRYEALNHAQGFAGTRGFGLLDDQHGNDEYIALGRDEVGWIPGHRFTMAQGFGIGMRPWFGGGIGVLRDLFGNDTYQADVYGQGAGYWYALGILFDSTGRDRYVAKQYAQGAGIHLAAGALIDLEGDDTYVCGAICQGGAHDFSVGLLHDARGNDSYTGSSTAQGAAINNSVAILLDQRGNDSYTGEIFDDSQGSGHDGGRRQYGSIALLLDFSGQDTYSQGWTDGMMWLKPHHGAGLDTQEPFTIHHRLARPRPPRHLPAQIALWGRREPFFAPARPVDATHPTEILFRRMMRSPLNDAEKAENAETADELRENALEHLPFLIGRMDSKNIMPRIVVEQMVDQLGDDAIDALVEGLNSPHPDVVRSCLYYLARLESHEAIPKIVALGADRKLAGNCLYTLGNLRAPEAFDLAMKRSLDARELVRIRAAQALANCPEPAATMRLIHMLKDPFYSVRFAAEDSLVQKGDSILPLLARGALGASNTTLKHIDTIRIRLGDSGHIPTALERYPSPRKLREAVEKKLRESAPPDQLHDE